MPNAQYSLTRIQLVMLVLAVMVLAYFWASAAHDNLEHSWKVILVLRVVFIVLGCGHSYGGLCGSECCEQLFEASK